MLFTVDLQGTNQFRIARVNPTGEPALRTSNFTTGTAYVEVGYGVENIFKFFRVDFIHRLSYLDPIANPDARKFGVLFTAQFKL